MFAFVNSYNQMVSQRLAGVYFSLIDKENMTKHCLGLDF